MTWFVTLLKKITSKRVSVDRWFSFRGFFAQPIFDKAFVQNKPTFHTPCPRFYVANLDMTYPYDRGTNYAVALGKEVSTIISNELPR
ncbi:MAG: hypothetical protein UZ21_OP11001001109 [Microgenomates bacterium OLB22]|nr:MAG: hypothetical protein UZ21_OP11001001109 [Microgenomates bacterium OLB22]